MQQLKSLIQEASNLGAASAEREVARIMQICNACRYCEGFCAVFPAMTRRIEFNTTDVHYLANLAEIKNVREIITGINPMIPRIIT